MITVLHPMMVAVIDPAKTLHVVSGRVGRQIGAVFENCAAAVF
jgi:hypothetical protein